MAPTHDTATCTMSEKKKGKQRAIDHSTMSDPTAAMGISESMDVDHESEGHSSASSYPLERNILEGSGITQAGSWANWQDDARPQFLPDISFFGDSDRAQGILPWDDTLALAQDGNELMLNGILENEFVTQASGPGAGTEHAETVSCTTETTYPDIISEFEFEKLSEQALAALRIEHNDPWLGLPILKTITNGFPYSFLHGKSKPYVCQWLGCGKKDRWGNPDRTFDTPSALFKHQRHHSEDDARPHKCERCDKTFKYPKDLRRHRSGVHLRQKLFPCKSCHLKFPRLDGLKRHEQSKDGCGRALRKLSSASSSVAPRTPNDVPVTTRPRPRKPRTSSSASQLQGLSLGVDNIEIASNSSYPFPGVQNPGPYY